MPDLIVKLLPWGIAIIAISVCLYCLELYEEERVRFAEFKSAVTATAKAQEAKIAEQQRQHEMNLKEIRIQYENKITSIRADAVRNYGLRYTATNSGGMPENGSGIKMDDGASKKPLADTKFIGDCGDDAAKLTAFQDYCKRNNCPIN